MKVEKNLSMPNTRYLLLPHVARETGTASSRAALMTLMMITLGAEKDPPRNLILLFLKKSWKVGGSQKKLETVMIYSLS